MAGYKGNTFQSDLLKLIFQAMGIANLADNTATSPLTSLYASLHTADPGAGGTASTNEIGYTSYARAAIARSSSGFTISGSSPTSCNLAANVSFPTGTGGSGTVTNFSITTASSGASKILYSGGVTPNLTTGNGITPILTTSTVMTED